MSIDKHARAGHEHLPAQENSSGSTRLTTALLVSGDTGALELMRVRFSGVQFLTKPVAPAKLRSVLRNLLAVANSSARP